MNIRAATNDWQVRYISRPSVCFDQSDYDMKGIQKTMKKVIGLAIIILLAGCGQTVRETGFHIEPGNDTAIKEQIDKTAPFDMAKYRQQKFNQWLDKSSFDSKEEALIWLQSSYFPSMETGVRVLSSTGNESADNKYSKWLDEYYASKAKPLVQLLSISAGASDILNISGAITQNVYQAKSEINISNVNISGTTARIFKAGDQICIKPNTIIAAGSQFRAYIDGDIIASFPSPQLEAKIRSIIGKPSGDIFTKDLQYITDLDCSYSTIPDLRGIENLYNLMTLRLRGYNFSLIIELLKKLPRLNSLYIAGGFSSINSISALTNLKELTIRGSVNSAYLTDITFISNLTKLENLDLEGNDVSSVTALSGLTNLTRLVLRYNRITNLAPLSGLTKLEYLTLRDNLVTDISALSQLVNLKHLDLYNMPIYPSSYPNGTRLNVVNNLTPLQNLTNLTTLYLSGDAITSITPLTNLTKLINLSINGNNWAKSLKSSLSNLVALKNMKELTNLCLTGVNLQDVSILGSLTSLESVSLWYYTNISDITCLSSLTNLVFLNLYANSVTSVYALNSLTNLIDVDLRYNNMDITNGSSNFQTVKSLINRGCDVNYVDGNRTNCPVPPPDGGEPDTTVHGLIQIDDTVSVIQDYISNYNASNSYSYRCTFTLLMYKADGTIADSKTIVTGWDHLGFLPQRGFVFTYNLSADPFKKPFGLTTYRASLVLNKFEVRSSEYIIQDIVYLLQGNTVIYGDSDIRFSSYGPNVLDFVLTCKGGLDCYGEADIDQFFADNPEEFAIDQSKQNPYLLAQLPSAPIPGSGVAVAGMKTQSTDEWPKDLQSLPDYNATAFQQWQKGDILFIRSNTPAGFLIKNISAWTHVGMVYNAEKGTTLESNLDLGVNIYKYNEKWGNDCKAYSFERRKVNVAQSQINTALEEAKGQWSGRVPFMPNNKLKTIMSKDSYLALWFDKDDKSSMYCAKLVYSTYELININLDRNITLSKHFGEYAGSAYSSWIGVSPDDINQSFDLTSTEYSILGLENLKQPMDSAL